MSARAKTEHKKRGQSRRKAQVAARAAWVRGKHGVLLTEFPANLPNKPGLNDERDQTSWFEDKLTENGVGGVVECYPALVVAMKRRGLHVASDLRNPGGVGNAAVSKKPFQARSSYRCTYRANSGARTTLHMVRVVTKPSRFVRHTVDVVHVPSTGRYKTSASEVQKGWVIEQIARHKAPTRSRSASGDWNSSKEFVLHHLRKVDKRWQYLGGAGVEMTFGIRCKAFGETSMPYGRNSDHHQTARTVYGVRGRII